MPRLEPEEYVEQAYLYRALLERLPDGVPLQELLVHLRQETLSTTKLPMAVDFLLSELRHTGLMSSAMARLKHYFHPFQSYVVAEAEAERGRFDMLTALRLLQHEAEYRAKGAPPAGLFLFQFECLCRNRLKYDDGLRNMADDPFYDDDWRQWILTVRRQVGLVDFADLLYVRSAFALVRARQLGQAVDPPPVAVLFGEKEGKIAYANRQKDPLYLFGALQRHLGYPPVPRRKPRQELGDLVTTLQQKVERLEIRVKLLEEEHKGGIDITKFYGGKLPASQPDPTYDADPPPTEE